MEFVNNTAFPGKLIAGSTSDREMLYSVACKVTYLLENGVLVPVGSDQAWPIFEKRFILDGVFLGGDVEFRRNGIDIVVFGDASAPGGEPVRKLSITVECGRIHHELTVFGDRLWTKSENGLTASEPEPFTEMPLSGDRAYGGTSCVDGMQMSHGLNPGGRGLYLSEEDAERKPLPNVELTANLIQHWSDHVQPAGLVKRHAAPVMPKDADPAVPETIMASMLPSLFQQAIPELVAQPQDLGESLRLTGLSADGVVEFPLPPLHGPTVHVTVGELRSRFACAISSLVALAKQKALVVTYAASFRMLMRPMEKRRAVLRWPDQPSAILRAGEGRECA